MQTRTLRLGAPIALVALTGALAAGCGSSSSSSGPAGSGSPANAVDRAFVQQMIPHHMMAVQMAQTAPSRGQHGQIKALAGSITTTQDREIAEMSAIARRLGVKPAAMPSGGTSMGGTATGGGHMDHTMMGDARALGLSMDQMGMSMNMSRLDTARPFDRAFIDMMMPHHQGAIRMARAELARGANAQLKRIAQGIIAGQSKEIGEMNRWRTQWFGAASPAGGVPQA